MGFIREALKYNIMYEVGRLDVPDVNTQNVFFFKENAMN